MTSYHIIVTQGASRIVYRNSNLTFGVHGRERENFNVRVVVGSDDKLGYEHFFTVIRRTEDFT